MNGHFTVTTDKTKLNVELIHDFLSNRSYWAKGRTKETVEKSIQNSLCFAVLNEKEEQVGFARVVTDFAIFAWLLDVFILEEYRTYGLGKMLINNIMEHPDLKNLKRWGLTTKDAQELYKKFGFRNPTIAENTMEKLSD